MTNLRLWGVRAKRGSSAQLGGWMMLKSGREAPGLRETKGFMGGPREHKQP